MTDEAADWSPKRLSEMVGQAQAVQRLKPLVELSRERAEPLPHILLIGAEGMGKRTLAAVLASEMSAAIVTMAGPSLERGGDLMGILTALAERDVRCPLHRRNPPATSRSRRVAVSRHGRLIGPLRDGRGAHHEYPVEALHAHRGGREGSRSEAETARCLPGHSGAPAIF